MNTIPPQDRWATRRSRGRITRAQGLWYASHVLVGLVALFSLLLMPLLTLVALILCLRMIVLRHEWLLAPAGAFVIGGLIVACVQVNRSILAETKSFLPVDPRTVENAHLLPVEETLVRAVDSTMEPHAELLRSVEEQGPPEQLLRPIDPNGYEAVSERSERP